MTTDQLELAQQLYADHRPRDGKDAQLMVYNYVPRWFKENVPALYSTDSEPDPIIWRKFFLPEGRWTFYVTEYSEVAPDGTPDLFFGYLVSPLGPDCDELCYMSLEQIRDLRSPRLRLPIETDLWWRPVRLSTLKAKLYPEEKEKPEPAFQAGDNVWWYEGRSMVKTGSVQYTPHPDDDRVSVSCDERSAVNGGVVIGHIKHIAAADLHKGDGPTEEARAMRDLLYDDDGNLLSVNEIDPSTAAVLAIEAEGKGYTYAGELTQLSLF